MKNNKDKNSRDNKGAKPRRRIQEVKMDCFYCKDKKTPNFLEYDLLSKFISERGKIQARTKTGLCSSHQRKLTHEVKRARYLAFLPFVVRPE